MTGLSLCMIVRNEQVRLPVCLSSVDGLVDEIVVVDTGSTDATRQIARKYGATVIRHDFSRAHFAQARNRGLDAARGAFVLVLDADEVLVPSSMPAVRELVAAGDDVGWVTARRNIPHGSVLPAWVDHVVRLFPNRPQYRFRARVHETIDDAILTGGGRLRRSAIVLDHHLPPEEVVRSKWRWYVDLLEADVAANPDDPDRLVFLMADYVKLARFAEASAIAERVAQLRSDDFRAQLNAALCTFARGSDPAVAWPYLSAALELRPRDPEALQLVAALTAQPANPHPPLSAQCR